MLPPALACPGPPPHSLPFCTALPCAPAPACRPVQSCGWTGGVWDDRDIVSWASAGGKCISPEEAAQVLAADPEAEEVTIAASSDGNVTGACLVAGCGRAGRDRQMLGW